jgi:TRAP-type C4-dicarboxylate transport system substrate-binding protein
MRKYKFKVVLSLCIFFLFAVLLIPWVQSVARAAEFELKVGALNPENTQMGATIKSWMAKVQKDTNGRVHFTAYWGTLLTPPDAPNEVARGIVDIGNFSPGYFRGGGFDIFNNSDTFFYGIKPAAHRKLHLELRKKYPQLDGEYAKYGKLIVDDNVLYPMHLMTKKPVRTLADIKGMKIKAIAGYIPLLKELGAEPVMMSMFECYVALQKGILDGVLSSYENLLSLKFIEVVKSITELDLPYPAAPGLMINLNTWAKLPPDIQKVFENNAKFYSDENYRLMTDAVNENMAATKKAGIPVIELSKTDQAKLDDILYRDSQRKAADLDKKGLPGTAMLQDIRKFIASPANK